MINEVWADIPGYEGLYQVSNLGRVKSLARLNGRGFKLNEKILADRISSSGYSGVILFRQTNGVQFRVHRLVMLAFKGPSSLVVNHKNGIKSDNRLENLEYITNGENHLHAYKTGLKPINRGSKVASSKLDEIQVTSIKQSNEKYRILAAKYNVSISTISHIKNKRSWRHV